MALSAYKGKRVFSRTHEPRGRIKKSALKNRFVVHKHSARRLHYDLRLEMDGVLKSWAVPKGLSTVPLEKRLAVNVEDHPIEYADFEGSIPAGEYGAGDVAIWDKGRWECLEDTPGRSFEKGTIKFILYGTRLEGKWTLVRIKGEKNWLLFKDSDESYGKSAASGALTDPSVLTNAVKAVMPKAMKPQLASLVPRPPSGDNWIYEIKFDGYRLLSFIDHGKVRLVTRNGYDWTGKFNGIAGYCRDLPVKRAILDGEIIVPDGRGISNFQLLQQAIRDGRDSSFQYYVFDITFCDGYSLKKTPLGERKMLLERILANNTGSPVIYNPHLAGREGGAAFQSACSLGLEGIMAKDLAGIYEEKRTKGWVKIKCVRRQEFVIGGYTDPGGSRSKFGALMLGYYLDGKLAYCGKAGTGFDEKTLNSLYNKLRRIEISGSPFFNLANAEDVHWVKPVLAAEVSFMNWTEDSLLRQASFLGLREDKDPLEIVREEPGNAGIKEPSAFGVVITHPDRIIFGDKNLTKMDLAAYYEKIAGRMLKEIGRRPLVLVRCPGDIKRCFFQKHPADAFKDSVKTFLLKKKNAVKEYIYIEDEKSLLTLVQSGVIEFHIMDILIDNTEDPDRMVFDLDPGPDVKPEAVSAAALHLRKMLLEYGLESFVKTTGGKGLHIIVPVERLYGWEEIKNISGRLAEKFVERWPSFMTATMSKAMRKGRIFIDYFRNTPGASWAAPYTVRTRPGAPVSMPVDWDELRPDLRFDSFTVLNIDERLLTLKKDPWESINTVRQEIPASLLNKTRN